MLVALQGRLYPAISDDNISGWKYGWKLGMVKKILKDI
jgi:hypothetical protein